MNNDNEIIVDSEMIEATVMVDNKDYLPSTHTQVRRSVKFYMKNKIPFLFEVQNETLLIASNYGSYSTRNRYYTAAEITFIKNVKEYIVKNELYVPYLGKQLPPVPYFKVRPDMKAGDHFDQVVNIDIKSAYWQTAFDLGLLSKELYEKGNGVRKPIRLAAIGSLARKRRVYEFDGKKQRLLGIKREKLTEVLWDVICTKVGNVLTEVAKAGGKDFVFFWVDGIYVKKAAAGKVKAIFKKHGYDFKVNPIKSIDISERNVFVNLVKPELITVDGVEKKKTRKPFPFRETKNTKR